MKPNLLRFLILSVLLVRWTSSIAFAGGDLVNNGGGIAEKNILYAYQKIDTYIKLCLNSNFCKIDKNQRLILEQIKNGIMQERQNPEQLQFVSEKLKPGFFIIDGEVKVAKTGRQIGSPIFVNLDLLYTKNEMGYYIPTSLSESVAILVHELGHHYGSYTHNELDLLAVRVALMLQHKTYNTPMLPWSEQVSATVINPSVDSSYPDILIYVGDQVIDISTLFYEAVFCPKLFLPLPIFSDIPLSTKKPVGSLVHNVHWNKLAAEATNAVLSISANLSHQCKDSSDKSIRSQDFLIKINFTVNLGTDGKWTLENNSLQIQQSQIRIF